MSTDNFLKKAGSIVIALSCLLICAYAGVVARAKRVEVNAVFYYLVTEDTKMEVGAEFAKLEGGAGYLLEHNGAEYVTLAVYLEEGEAFAVQYRLSAAGRTTSLLQKNVQALYFKGKEKRESALYISGLNTLNSYIYLLKATLDSLADGLSQEKCKGLLITQLRQYTYAKEQYKQYEALSKVFAQSAEQLSAIVSDIAYLKDLRYLLCWQTEKYIALCSKFSI